MLEPSSSEESDVDGDEAGFGAAGVGHDVSRPGRPLPVLGGRVAGFAGVGAFGFGQSGLAGALNSGVSTSLSSNTSITASSTSSIVPPNIDLLHQRSHSLSTGTSCPFVCNVLQLFLHVSLLLELRIKL